MEDSSTASIFASAFAAAAAADSSASPSEKATDLSITESMVSYLRSEAALADEKAKRLRKQAVNIAKQFGITEDSQQLYDTDPSELAPLNENGQPKYKGKKRGRKPKVRKRKAKSDRPKRQHTGYTLFMQETYPSVKVENPDLPPKALISLVATLWKNLSIGDKTEWKDRAERINNSDISETTKRSNDTARPTSFSKTSITESAALSRSTNETDREYSDFENTTKTAKDHEDNKHDRGADDDSI
eukprot:jgi/Psemu1/285287/fgenesh1_pg.79_\